MVTLDHIPIWTERRDHLLAALREHAGLDSLDGYAPGGKLVARGVRFGNGPFLDVHQLSSTPDGFGKPFHRLIAFGASIDELEALAEANGWAAKAARRLVGAQNDQQPPWSLLSFRKGQGFVSDCFGIQYHPGAATTAEYGGPLYNPSSPASGDTALDRVWLPVDDLATASEVLQALGARPVGVLRSALKPHCGQAYQLGTVHLVLAQPWGHDQSIRLDIRAVTARPMELSPLAGLLVVLNEDGRIGSAEASKGDPPPSPA